MSSHHAGNERIKHAYFIYLREAKGMSEHSIDQTAKAISRFEAATRCRDFKAFHIEQAKSFKKHLAEQRSQRTGEPLTHATIYSTLSALKMFFYWLADKPGFRLRISYADADYFSMNMKDAGLPKRPAREGCRLWSRSVTSWARCRPELRSSAETAP